jgi:hypothetical protein
MAPLAHVDRYEWSGGLAEARESSAVGRVEDSYKIQSATDKRSGLSEAKARGVIAAETRSLFD